MIIYIDFASVGDASFYRLQWEKSLNDSKKKHFKIYTDIKHSFSNNHFAIPQNFTTYNLINNILKFISQSSIVLLLKIWTFLNRESLIVIFNLHQPFIYWQWLKYIKKNNVKIFGIIHDIVEFETSQYPRQIISSNKQIINILDAAILHGGESVFRNEYIFSKNIFNLPFPNRQPYEFKTPIINFQYFLLPGRYRKEKGFDFVINNWPKNNITIPLVVMAKVPGELEEIIKLNANILYRPNLNTTESFENLIMNCTAAILMYTDGTNSGILQTLIANQKKIITSPITIFTNHAESKHFIFCNNQQCDFQKLILNFKLSEYTQFYSHINDKSINSSYTNFLNKTLA